MNCPFYGRSALAFPILVNSSGNQCGVKVQSHSPCEMAIHGQTPDWRECPVMRLCFYPEAGGNVVRGGIPILEVEGNT